MDENGSNGSAWVPVFPLPETVLFPHRVLPLHLFEPRYLAMAHDALAGDQTLAIALLRPNYERLYFTRFAPIHRIVGVGRIISSAQLDDGKYNIVLQGFARARIVSECAARPYRRAQLELLKCACENGDVHSDELREELCRAVHEQLGGEEDLCEQYRRLFGQSLSLGALTDIIAGELPVTGELLQTLLEQPDCCRRARQLLAHIHTLSAIVHQRRQLREQSRFSAN